MANFYIVMQKKTAWGVGKTKEQAIANAAQRVPPQDNEQGISIEDNAQGIPIEEMKALIESCNAVENGSCGFRLEPISLMEWDEQLVDVDSSALAQLAWDQRGANCAAALHVAPRNPVIDTKYLTPVEDAAYCVNRCHATEFSSELLAASYALNNAEKAGKGFSKEEIEYYLKALVAAQAKFAYVIALGRAMTIASLYYNE